MWPNPPFSADLVTFTEEVFNRKLSFLCSVSYWWVCYKNSALRQKKNLANFIFKFLIVRQTEFFWHFGHFLPSTGYPYQPTKCHHFTLVYQKSWSYNVCFLKYGAWQDIIFGHFGPFFDLLRHFWPPKLTFRKNVKKTKTKQNKKLEILSHLCAMS